jgi:hypothetical protein
MEHGYPQLERKVVVLRLTCLIFGSLRLAAIVATVPLQFTSSLKKLTGRYRNQFIKLDESFSVSYYCSQLCLPQINASATLSLAVDDDG